MSFVSIIMPSYNSAYFIADSIRSIQKQTFEDWELIISDDCSSDNSFALISELANQDNRIKVYRLDKNGGAALARNNSLKYAKGRFIAFLDSDDLWKPEKLEKQLKFMLDNNYPISFTSYEVLDENLKSTNTIINSVKEIDYSGYLKNTIIGMSTSMIDRDKVGSFEFFNIRTRQDTYLWITLLKRGFKAYGIQEILAQYRVRSNSISANKWKAAKRVWYLYYDLEKLGLFKASYYFSCYMFNAIKKRL
ncbi:glycosyltransferase family 2 protein [Myroides odoratimimus]|uniref:glycosyltransferase family 2 protein n=1 Tax=Myroides odoratimimus TaxID=76832 RepID=UPI002578E7D9|nr:glycosyltransferase family 2 protein [Myroides odoratimimus]MDM1450403.1 glycosyltransferase family 2 protein [Myroides odoratimimus]